MSIDKLTEFAKLADDKSSNTDGLELEKGFPTKLQPARQWFNWLMNTLTKKINEIIDGKLDADATAVSAKKLSKAINIGGVSFDGSQDIDLAGVNKKGNQDTSGNAATSTKLATARKIALSGIVQGEANFDGSGDITIETTGGETLGEKAIAVIRFNGTSFNLVNSRGFSSVTKVADGQIEFTLQEAAPNLDYGLICTGTARGSAAISLQENEDFVRTQTKFQLLGAYGGDNTLGPYTPKICTVVVYY